MKASEAKIQLYDGDTLIFGKHQNLIYQKCCRCGLWHEIHVGLLQTRVTNAQFIQSERDLKDSLTSQLLYVENLNTVHGLVVEMERPVK